MGNPEKKSGKTDAGDAQEPIRRQAIVVVHGQGEQRPMGTIRDFVETLWTRNYDIKLQDVRLHDKQRGNRSWIIPDDKGGLYDIQRITCPALEDGRRTDFFELYYADIFSGTPLGTLWRWLRRLLWINPAHVTDRMRWPWRIFWLLAFCAVVLLGAIAVSARDIFQFDWVGVITDPEVKPGVYLALGAVVLLLLPRLTPLANMLSGLPARIAGVLGFAGLAYIFWPYPVFWYLSGLWVEIFLAARFLLPYFGDAASYLSAHTETVDSRQKVWSRGLGLLRALHDDPAYDRVVVVGHSLGSVLAYDLLHILWGQVGPLNTNPPDEAAAAALEKVDAFVRAHPGGDWSDFEVAAYQRLQWKAYDLLRRQKGGAEPGEAGQNGWKISDFVSLGSPLTSAQFIMADGPEDLEQLRMDRVMPTAPPRPYNSEFLSSYRDKKGNIVVHHGSVFSVVRWSNVFDPFHPLLILLGDPIGGPVSGRELFGAGVLDVSQKIERPDLLNRIFTHNSYWENTSGDWNRPAAHILLLRELVGIDRQVPQ